MVRFYVAKLSEERRRAAATIGDFECPPLQCRQSSSGERARLLQSPQLALCCRAQTQRRGETFGPFDLPRGCRFLRLLRGSSRRKFASCETGFSYCHIECCSQRHIALLSSFSEYHIPYARAIPTTRTSIVQVFL